MTRSPVSIAPERAGTPKVRAFKPRLPFEALHRLLQICGAKRPSAELCAALRDRAAKAATEDWPWSLDERVICLVLADLATLGWRFSVAREVIYLMPRSLADTTISEAKAQLRESLLDGRAKQLADPSVRGFLLRLHEPRLHGGALVSIENLVDDGAQLAAGLRGQRFGGLCNIVKPYVQLAQSGKRCSQTGLDLGEIWRYFRHTWSLEFRSTPGRTLNFLIRNMARPHHPVIAIVGLANTVFQLRSRDSWIGWTVPCLVKRFIEEPSLWPKFRSAAVACLKDSGEAIRSDDLLREIRSKCEPLVTVGKLRQIAQEQANLRKVNLRAEHEGLTERVSTRAIAKLASGARDWKTQSEQPLFKRKRADALADIIFAEFHLSGTGRKPADFAPMVRLETDRDGQPKVVWANDDIGKAIGIALREIKKNGVATRMLDVNVCGATPVYRELLGGKLAAMSLFAREIGEAYAHQYGGQASEIASSMAGRPIFKDTDLCVLTTTSLYGVGSSQYNRVRFPYDAPKLRWQEIGATEGFGTIHMTKQTVLALREKAIGRTGLRNVNNQFGEGTSPLLRQLREGLSALGFEANEILQHGQNRIIYAAELYPEAREDLLLNKASRSERPPMADIAAEWTRRWLAMRIQSDEVLARISVVNAASVRSELRLEGAQPQKAISSR